MAMEAPEVKAVVLNEANADTIVSMIRKALTVEQRSPTVSEQRPFEAKICNARRNRWGVLSNENNVDAGWYITDDLPGVCEGDWSKRRMVRIAAALNAAEESKPAALTPEMLGEEDLRDAAQMLLCYSLILGGKHSYRDDAERAEVAKEARRLGVTLAAASIIRDGDRLLGSADAKGGE